MTHAFLKHTINALAQECVLVPAWKKAHDYIRRHNWYSDVLELDLTNADLSRTIRQVASDIESSTPLRSTPLRLIMAPKTQAWHIKHDRWAPVNGPKSAEHKLRPLAHVTVRDQIIATAFMMVLADLIETRQGDPRASGLAAHRKRMVSYGHRLFCDSVDRKLQFRWGNSSVYRQYFQDYQNYVARPEQVVEHFFPAADPHWAVVSADISQFYDRVRPALLHAKVKALLGKRVDSRFFDAFCSFFDWSWHEADLKTALAYASKAQPQPISGFDHVALPQGLVPSGFFSNVVLLDFDYSIKQLFGKWNETNEWQLIDYCRYVDDMRFVIRLSHSFAELKHAELESRIITSFYELLTSTLDDNAPDLLINRDKCGAVLGRNAAAGSIRVSSSMRRVNHNASGVMDLFIGEQTLELIETLLYSSESTQPLGLGGRFQDTVLAAKPDVREETVARFAANRFRSAYRGLRPMAEPEDDSQPDNGPWGDEDHDEWNPGQFQLASTLNRIGLDHKATHFASRLVERWIRDPSNMRLLRVALDICPEVRTLRAVLELLNEYLRSRRRMTAAVRIAMYCGAELLKAGATETGLVNDEDKLPAKLDLDAYQRLLADFARQIVLRKDKMPWYLLQQAYLFLACFGDYVDQDLSTSTPTLAKYIQLHKVLSGDYNDLSPNDVPKFTLLHAGLRNSNEAAKAFQSRWTNESLKRQRAWLIHILSEHKNLSLAIWKKLSPSERRAYRAVFEDYGVLDSRLGFPSTLRAAKPSRGYSLISIACSSVNPFRQEYLAIHFALKLVYMLSGGTEAVPPSHVLVSAPDWEALQADRFPIRKEAFSIQFATHTSSDQRFVLPKWIASSDGWKYQLGMLLRVLLTGRTDYTLDSSSHTSRTKVIYNPYRSSWLGRRYGMFNGRNAFGPPWLPISSWLGSLLGRLLEWPGCVHFNVDFQLQDDFTVADLVNLLRKRVRQLERLYGRSSRMPLLPIRVPRMWRHASSWKGHSPDRHRQLRVCVAQTVIPRKAHFKDYGSQLLVDGIRREHRRHSASVLAGVKRMLEIRTSHQGSDVGIDLLVLPELSIHPRDVNALLLPFVKQNKCIVCAGLVFHPLSEEEPRLINSAVWLIPIRKPTGGLDVQVVHQGKMHMTQDEKLLHISPFRPVQWVLEIADPQRWSRMSWSMTSSICYDATDLSLAADLCNHTHLFVVPALNNDVGTFDNMAAALHYHMFQHIIVANSGEYGGSSGHAPFVDRHRRTLFHMHGNEQAAVSFFEVDIAVYRSDKQGLKTPPANFRRDL